jgi:hypothetical protein
MYGHYDYSFVGNVLGTADESPVPYTTFAYEDAWPWKVDPIGLWRLGYTPKDWFAQPEARVVSTTHRHGNFDYATGTVHWTDGFDQTLPSSFYLAGKPDFFGATPWPWVDPTASTPLQTLPARARYDAGTPHTTRTLTVSRTGIGRGAVASSPDGIACGLVCSASYTAGSLVTLSATPEAGSHFVRWSGACSGTGSCQVAMGAARTANAEFARNPVALTVSKTGNGRGLVTSFPVGIRCGVDCSADFPSGLLVTLSAVPEAGSTFAGWSGACTGSGPCRIRVDQATAVTATFTRRSVALALNLSEPVEGGATQHPLAQLSWRRRRATMRSAARPSP